MLYYVEEEDYLYLNKLTKWGVVYEGYNTNFKCCRSWWSKGSF